LATGVGALTSKNITSPRGIIGSTMITIKPPHLVVPMITGEQIDLTYLKYNNKGKPVGNPELRFVFDFSISTPMNSNTAGDAGNYQIDWSSTKMVKHKVVKTLHSIGFAARFNAAKNSVTLFTIATPKTFANGGQLTIIAAPPHGVSSAAGVFLAASAQFTILPKATGIERTS
jgi:hypothetical protein